MVKMLVPIKIDCLIVNGDENNRKHASLTPRYDAISEGIVLGDMIAGDQIFETTRGLEKGVHIHWHLPDGLIRGIKEAGESTVLYPAVPDIWLVTRFWENSNKLDLKAWIVESNNIYYKEWPDKECFVSIPVQESGNLLWFRYLGRKYDFKDWKEQQKCYLNKLTAMGPGDPFFSKYYPNCRNVFGMHDDLRDLGSEKAHKLAYSVIGWYSNSKHGPFHNCNLESWNKKIKDLKWELKDEETKIYGFPTDVIFAGATFNILWRGEDANYDSGGSSGEISIAVGNNSAEALSALIQSKFMGASEDISRLLDALQHGHLSKLDTSPDGMAEIEIGNYQRTFTPVSGGVQWIATPAESAKEETNPPHPLTGKILAGLNTSQNYLEQIKRKRDLYQWELYSSWYKYIMERDGPFHSRQEIAKISHIVEEMEEDIECLNIKINFLSLYIDLLRKMFASLSGKKYKLDNIVGPQFYQANDPALMISGLEASRENCSEFLTCHVWIDGECQDNEMNCLGLPEKCAMILAKVMDCVKRNETDQPCINSWSAPKTQMFLLWEAELFAPELRNWVLEEIGFGWPPEDPPDPEGVHNLHEYQGMTVLSPHAYQNMLDKSTSLAKKIEDLNPLSQSLGGFNENLIMRKQSLQFPVFDRPKRYGGDPDLASKVKDLVGEMNHLSPLIDYDFNPIREGFLRFSRIWVVDSFGQIQELDVSPERIIIAESMRTEKMDGWITVAPRIVQPSRLNFRWISASHDEPTDTSLTSETSPILGWVIPNHLDDSLMIYDSSGSALGVLHGKEGKVIFEPPQGVGCDEPLENGSPLKNFVEGIRKKGPSAFESLLGHIDETVQGIEALGSRHDQNLSVLVGRPLALVRASLKLELYGPPVFDQSWESLGKFDTKDFEKVKFPVRLGDVNLLKDGLVGYFIEDGEQTYDKFHSAYGFDENTQKDGSDYVISDHNDHHDNLIKLTCDPQAKPVLLTLLIDPRGGIHITSGILPTKFIELPHHHISEALSKMEVSFRIAPLIASLTADDAIDMPLPSVSKGGWSFSYQESQGKWRSMEATSKEMNAISTPGERTIIEGWLKLNKGVEEDS